MSEFTKIVEEYHDIPSNRSSLIDTIKVLIESGGVQKISVEHNKGIEIKRAVKFPGNYVDQKESAELFISSRNSEVEALDDLGDPLKTLMKAFNIISARNLIPRAFLVSDHKVFFKSWLKDKDIIFIENQTKLMNVPVYVFGDIPNDSAILVGTMFDDSFTVRYSVKFSLEQP